MELNGCPPVLMNFEHQHDRDAVLAKSSSLDKQSGIVVNIILHHIMYYVICMYESRKIYRNSKVESSVDMSVCVSVIPVCAMN